MNPLDLPIVGVPSNAHGHDFFGQYSNLSGKRLLCIGFSETEVMDYVAVHEPASITVLTNWVEHIDARVDKFPLVIGDITKRTQFSDNSFDAVLTLSVLEHLGDLSGAFSEMTRLVRSGGEMLHMFGPAWSCAYGHHLYADPADPNLNFVAWAMPAHIHLLSSRQEITKYYLDLGYPQSTADTVLHWFYDAPLINRRSYDEYTSLMRASVLHTIRMELMSNSLPPEHRRRLERVHPGHRDFETYGGRYHLIVRK